MFMEISTGHLWKNCNYQSLDDATCRTARLTMHWLRGEFGERFISRVLTPSDYFLLGYVKAHVHIREMPADVLERVCQNWIKRMDHLKRIRGKHLHEIIFKH